MQDSWAFKELYSSRNAKNAFKYGGLFGGLTINGISGWLGVFNCLINFNYKNLLNIINKLNYFQEKFINNFKILIIKLIFLGKRNVRFKK